MVDFRQDLSEARAALDRMEGFLIEAEATNHPKAENAYLMEAKNAASVVFGNLHFLCHTIHERRETVSPTSRTGAQTQ